MVPQPYSRMATPTPSQPFTPPTLNPATPGSSHKGRGGILYQSPNTPQFNISTPLSSQIAVDEINGSVLSGSLKEEPKPTVKESLVKFENVLAGLVESISKFRPSIEKAQDLIEVDQELTNAIEHLVDQYKSSLKVERLRSTSEALDEQLNDLLVTLADCRRALRSLPRPEKKYVQKHSSDPTEIGVVSKPAQDGVMAKELLKYATKITKFTSAPPGFQSAPEMANLPWPTEDGLRKGVLALFAINETTEVMPEVPVTQTTNKETEGFPLSGSPPSDSAKNTNVVGDSDPSNGFAERRNSATGFGASVETNGSAPLELDLFDPDEEDDDDMEDI